MKIFREVIIVFGIYYIGELLSVMLHLPLPGSLVGMILLLLLLSFHIIRVEHVQSICDFLLGHLPFFFIPAGVALLNYFEIIKDTWVLIILICFITTILTMGCSGFMIQKIMQIKGKKHG